MPKLIAEVTVPYVGHSLECPFCNQRILVEVDVKLKDIDIRHSGTHGFDKQFSITTGTEIDFVKVSHQCNGPKKED